MTSPISAIRIGEYDTGTGLADVVGQRDIETPDQDIVGADLVFNSKLTRKCAVVYNGSGGTLPAGAALKWVTGYYGTRVQKATNGAPICGYVPYTINGSTSATVPNAAYFLMIHAGPTAVQTDGDSLSEGDIVEAGGTAGQIKTEATAPAANKHYSGGYTLAAAAAQGTGDQVFVRIMAQCN